MKKLLACFMSISVLFSWILLNNNVALAADIIMEDEIIQSDEVRISELFAELNNCILDASKYTEDEYNALVLSIENELKTLGVEPMETSDVYSFVYGDDTVSPCVNVPSDTNTVKWYSSMTRNYAYNSKTYDIQTLYAVGNNPGGMLYTGQMHQSFFDDGTESVINVGTLFAIYVQKAIGLIPVIQWAPYELLFSPVDANVVHTYSDVTHQCVSTLAFSYVKESSMGEYDYSLSYFTNQFTVAFSVIGGNSGNSNVESYSKSGRFSEISDTYASVACAVKSYVGVGARSDYIDGYTMESYDGKYELFCSVPNPMGGPGQVY